MVTASYMVEAIRAHQRRRLLLRAFVAACCLGLLAYVAEGSGPLITIPGRVVADDSGTERELHGHLGDSLRLASRSVRIRTERGTFSWHGSVPSDVWVDGVVGRISGTLHVRHVRPREHR
ncbi:MAG TPA: hypothetical protein VFK05_19605 [Polyangiaceae bacterium]|nr:hypothetical protein [Polyangiaceae bacterium]